MSKKEHVSFNNQRVINVLAEAKKSKSMSKLVEDAMLFYLDNINNSTNYTTREDVKDILIEYFGQIALNGNMKNPNYTTEKVDISKNIDAILDL